MHVHAPSARWGAFGGQVRQSVEEGPEHVAQLLSHAAQDEEPLAKCVEGHTARHTPPWSLGACAGHERHCEALGPEHVTQLPSHP